MNVGITVEERRWQEVIPHGIAAGIVASIALGLVQLAIAVARGEGALTPFRQVASLVLGPDTLQSGSSTAVVIVVGSALHFALGALFGTIFVAGLAVAFQLSARSWMQLGYGSLFGFLLWEINFLAALPALYPDLSSRIEFAGQIWKGIVAYTLVYGPALGLYVIARRPGVLSDWKG